MTHTLEDKIPHLIPFRWSVKHGFIFGQLLVGAKHLEDKLSDIAKNSSPNASPVQLSVVSWKINYRSLPKIVLQMLRPYSCLLYTSRCV
ncbi:hypothetical protein [Dolichospermum sp. UHCC 0299]|uniref:hypothetical protein n=1 Tax=Dolichospermum sp. UHCC 0299 TaxID=2590014 RepID=UPI00144686CB|nr:hypothetical protein [Dolichospermum sp. UHCC 0299]